MGNPHYYVPAGLPPGAGPMQAQSGPPEGVYYYRIFAGIMASLCALLAVAGMGMFLVPLFSVGGSASTPPSSLSPGEMIAGVFYAGLGIVLFIPFLLSLVGGRNSWVHTLGTVLIALTLMSLCCLPVSIPMLIVWLKPETKRWYGAA